MTKLKKHLPTVILLVVFLVGLCLLIYPTFSDWWNSMRQSRAIVAYSETVAAMDNEEYDAMWERAVEYNTWLFEENPGLVLSEDELAAYEDELNVTDSGIMCYLEIPKLDLYLPVYHGTSSAVLQTALGHLEGTSLPVGGESTHTVISGHRGLASARLFTDLDLLEIGDTFTIYTLDEALEYEVDQILIVLPTEVDALKITEGEDYCTLLTCTPYGVNDHRLLVRGHRIESDSATTIRVTADAIQVDTILVAPLIAAPILVVLLIVLLVRTRRRKIKH